MTKRLMLVVICALALTGISRAADDAPLLLQSRDTMDTPLIIGLMAVIGGLGVLSDRLMLLFMTKVLGMDVR